MTDNPLSKLYRHKSIYIQLPSKGRYYTSGINLSIDNDLGIMPMTAKDEIALKSPDALFNGDGLINMIKSCIPDIKNPEEIPACDIDPIIIGIRAASKKTIELEVECPHCKKTDNYEIDLLSLISSTNEISEEDFVIINNIRINVRPYSLKSQLKSNIQKFHHKRMEYILSTNEIEDDKKLKMFSKAFTEATNLSMELVSDNIVSVELTKEEIVTNSNNIRDWVENMDKETYNIIIEKIKEISKSTIDNKVTVFCPTCEKQYETIVELNPVNFFI
jgi:hypothetical protein